MFSLHPTFMIPCGELLIPIGCLYKNILYGHSIFIKLFFQTHSSEINISISIKWLKIRMGVYIIFF
jgi:hypothetical protein